MLMFCEHTIGWIQAGLGYISLLELSLKGSLAFGTGSGKQNREAALRCDRPRGCLSCLCPRALEWPFHLQERRALREAGRRPGDGMQVLSAGSPASQPH